MSEEQTQSYKDMYNSAYQTYLQLAKLFEQKLATFVSDNLNSVTKSISQTIPLGYHKEDQFAEIKRLASAVQSAADIVHDLDELVRISDVQNQEE